MHLLTQENQGTSLAKGGMVCRLPNTLWELSASEIHRGGSPSTSLTKHTISAKRQTFFGRAPIITMNNRSWVDLCVFCWDLFDFTFSD